MNERLNNALLRLTRRAESAERQKLVETFVDFGTLMALLSSLDHQVIYGRRGTGKTHALLYLAENANNNDDISVYLDMRTVGSTGGLYGDTSIPVSERATRLLSDTLLAIHDSLLTRAIEKCDLNLASIGSILDALAESSAEVVVVGEVEEEIAREVEGSGELSVNTGIEVGEQGANVALSAGGRLAERQASRSKTSTQGHRRHRVHFGAVGTSLAKLIKALGGKRIWLLLDEWSVVPIELQPYLADFIRRSVFPVAGITVKIAAIEQRTRLQLAGTSGDYVGIELGADASADVNLDDFMVFDYDALRATNFFRELLFRHYLSVAQDVGITDGPATSHQFVQVIFTQRNSFEELMRASEGVPRDAINILLVCAQKAGSNQISVHHVRVAAKAWYQRDKEAAVSANQDARELLYWINDEVIGRRRARAFLVKSGINHPLIEALFDSRVLHVLKRNISAHDQPGVRYDAYKIDYGCYVDLLTTAKAPQGLLPMGNQSEELLEYAEVPPDDYRSIRRAILDISAFTTSR